MREHYRHTQIGTLIAVVLGGGAAFALAASIATRSPVALIVVAIMLVLMPLFSWMTIEIRDGCVRARMGVGPFGRTVQLEDIAEARAVRNAWWYGWGIHLTPHGWLYNVSGFEAVELVLHSGKKLRLGTDEPRELVRAIERARERCNEERLDRSR